MNPAAELADFSLRRRFGRYLVAAAVAAMASAAMVLRILATRDWRLFGSLEIGWILFAVWLYLGLSYQVLWRGGKLVLKVLGKPEVVVAPDEITGVEKDTEARAKLAGITRSSDRIKIAAKAPWDAPKSIYVSLGHFQPADIKRLMAVLATLRPDLGFPRQWVQNCDTPGWKP